MEFHFSARGNAEPSSAAEVILPPTPPFAAEENRKERRKLKMQDHRPVGNVQQIFLEMIVFQKESILDNQHSPV